MGTAEAVSCIACLDSRRCWVCLGHGTWETPTGLTPCRACVSTGRCATCDRAAIPGQRDPGHDVLPVSRTGARR